MGLLNFLDTALDVAFSPLLHLNYFFGILVLSVVLSLLITLVYKWTTNQELMKSLKEDLKKIQDEVKKFQKDNPQKALDKQKIFMQKNMEYMKHSFRSTFYTIIPLLIIFGWMQANLAYMPIMPGDEFSMALVPEPGFRGNVTIEVPDGLSVVGEHTKPVENGRVSFTLAGSSVGEHDVVFDVGGELHAKNVKVSTWRDYAPTVKAKKGFFASYFGWLYSSKAGYLDADGAVRQITTTHQPVKPFGKLRIFGWMPGWLATYIFFSILTSLGVRKVLKVY